MRLWNYPLALQIEQYDRCVNALVPVTESWTRWYQEQRDAMTYMRSLALSYNE